MIRRHLPPHGDLLHSVANARHDWWLVLAEWIDNAFDAKARTVAIEFGKDFIRIQDDGIGCADPANMIRLGAHSKHATTKLGRYGIGGKEAALWCGGISSTVEIASVLGDVERVLVVQWLDYMKEWNVDPNQEFPAAPGRMGTMITIRPLQRKPPVSDRWSGLLVRLGYVYSAALKQGRQIKFRRPGKSTTWEPLIRWELPKFEGAVIDERIVVNDRCARLYCGVVRQGEPNPQSGLTYSHSWRVIEEASANGCGDYGTQNVCGFVELDESWPLTKNKDAISKDSDLLYAEVERVARPVLERARAIGSELASQQFLSEVNRRLNASLGPRAKAKRSRGVDTGTKNPTGAGGQHRQAQREQEGERFTAKRGGGWRIGFASFGAPDAVGKVKPGREVVLNSDNPAIAFARGNSDWSVVVMSAASLIAVEHCYRSADSQPLLRGIEQSDFAVALGGILAGALTFDGKAVMRIA